MSDIVCPACGELRLHHAKGLCARCYNRKWRAENPFRHHRQGVRHRRRRPPRAARRGSPSPSAPSLERTIVTSIVDDMPQRTDADREARMLTQCRGMKAVQQRWYEANFGPLRQSWLDGVAAASDSRYLRLAEEVAGVDESGGLAVSRMAARSPVGASGGGSVPGSGLSLA